MYPFICIDSSNELYAFDEKSILQLIGKQPVYVSPGRVCAPTATQQRLYGPCMRPYDIVCMYVTSRHILRPYDIVCMYVTSRHIFSNSPHIWVLS